MKKYSLAIIALFSVLCLSIIAPRLVTQSSRLSKVGYLNLEQVINNIIQDEKLVANIEAKIEAAKQDNTYNEIYKSDEKGYNERDRAIRAEVKRQVANALLTIVRREGYTLILERTESTILYADRNFDITDRVTAFVQESLK